MYRGLALVMPVAVISLPHREKKMSSHCLFMYPEPVSYTQGPPPYVGIIIIYQLEGGTAHHEIHLPQH